MSISTEFISKQQDKVRLVLQDVISNLYNSTSSTSFLSINMINTIKQDVKNLLLTSDFDKNYIIRYLNNKSWNDERIECFITVIEENRSTLLYDTLINHNASYCESIMNFDWNIKLVLGSSELKAVKYPLMQLMFATRTLSSYEDDFGCELNKNVLAKLIDVLEATLK
ncbi:hypothetical protein K1T71_008771 [Dendrolimus kikuchii]|uniref:Uncharacterized protein n=1 Tax=Dendrolimus kikuchii TaxID=765133 RepID=A0ACC1CWW9_9NEOP|nr:hypothetical protein K1T71_008771 [Dendrolimus kikuchii]